MISITRRRLASPVIALVALATFAGVASAAPVTFQKFGDGNVTITATGAKLNNDAGEYSGIYVKSKSLNNKPLANVHVSFMSTGDVAGGAPRFSIPLNTGSYAFLDVNNCGTPGVVSSDDATCQVFINTGGSFANWAAMAAAQPTWRVSKTAVPFIIADVAGNYEVSNVDLR
jgi:hypothetical protein